MNFQQLCPHCLQSAPMADVPLEGSIGVCPICTNVSMYTFSGNTLEIIPLYDDDVARLKKFYPDNWKQVELSQRLARENLEERQSKLN